MFLGINEKYETLSTNPPITTSKDTKIRELAYMWKGRIQITISSEITYQFFYVQATGLANDVHCHCHASVSLWSQFEFDCHWCQLWSLFLCHCHSHLPDQNNYERFWMLFCKITLTPWQSMNLKLFRKKILPFSILFWQIFFKLTKSSWTFLTKFKCFHNFRSWFHLLSNCMHSDWSYF